MSSCGALPPPRRACRMAGRLRRAVVAGLGDARTGLLGRRIRPRIVFRVKSVALLTTISVPLTIAYDLWTASGEWYFITRRLGVTWDLMLKGQAPFTLYHLLSSLIFVPLVGTAFLFLHTYGWPARSEEIAPSRPMVRP